MYNFKKVSIMKKNFLSMKSISMILLSCLFSVCLASCGGDDNGNEPTPKPSKKATTASAQVGVYVTTGTLDYFDVVVSDANGKTQTITKENTTVMQDITFGSFLPNESVSKAMVLNMIKQNDAELRLFKMPSETYTTFPVSMTYKVSATANGKTPAATDKVVLMTVPEAEVKNNSSDGSFNKLGTTGLFSAGSAISGSRWEKFITDKGGKVERSFTVGFAAADQCTLEYK